MADDQRALIESMVEAMNTAVYSMHGCFHINTSGPNIGMPVLHHQCNLGTCGTLNALIRRAEQQGYRRRGIPSRL